MFEDFELARVNFDINPILILIKVAYSKQLTKYNINVCAIAHVPRPHVSSNTRHFDIFLSITASLILLQIEKMNF